MCTCACTKDPKPMAKLVSVLETNENFFSENTSLHGCEDPMGGFGMPIIH